MAIRDAAEIEQAFQNRSLASASLENGELRLVFNPPTEAQSESVNTLTVANVDLGDVTLE